MDGRKIHPKVFAFKISYDKANKVFLSSEELKALMAVDNDRLELSKNTFLLQLLCRGTRIGDVLSLNRSNIHNDRIQIIEQKTGKHKDIKIDDKVKSIINKYTASSNYGYVLPWMDVDPKEREDNKEKYQKKIESKTAMINKDLKVLAASAGINKKISTHTARHSFANLTLENGYKLHEIKELLNHSSVRQTEEYLAEIENAKSLDRITSSVLSFM